MSPAAPSSHVVGQWVSGERFYGRDAELAASLEGEGWVWWAGLRRVGKTSLLKQIEHLCLAEESSRVALFWDLQGVDGEAELAFTFTDALLDAEEPLAGVGIAAEALESENLWLSLDRLASALVATRTELLLLIDEADDLRQVEEAAPGTTTKLWQRLQATGQVRVILASSVRLEDRATAGEISPSFAEPFGEPRYLGPLSATDAQDLLRQIHLARNRRPEMTSEAAAGLATGCGLHPLLLQMAGRRFAELGDVKATCRQLCREPSVAAFLAVDFDLLRAEEQALLRQLAIASEHLPSPPGADLAARLRALGLVRAAANGRLEIANPVLLSWLRQTR